MRVGWHLQAPKRYIKKNPQIKRSSSLSMWEFFKILNVATTLLMQIYKFILIVPLYNNNFCFFLVFGIRKM